MRIVRMCRAVDGVATGVGGHAHHRHTVVAAAVDSLQVAVVEGVLL